MEKTMFKVATLVVILLLPIALFAQNGTITGKITDAKTGDALMGANVLIEGTTLGAAATMDGTYEIKNVPPGTFTLKISYMGYTSVTAEVQVTADEKVTANFELEAEIILGAQISILADRAKPRETPVAFTDVRKEDMEMRLGSQDIPLVMNTTPSVYATMSGGGAGDARVNVRGFDQRNVAIMINGVPVNDMENGWLYWSNWDGVADATSSIQMQRGLSATNLATPSIGGTMNIITDPTALQRGAKFKQEVGNDGFLKSTLSANSGLINGKYAFSGTVVRKTGDGLADGNWTDAWAYYFGGSYQVNKDNRIEVYALGAPQRHGQNLYMQNIGVYSEQFAKDLDGYDEAALEKYTEQGLTYNQNWHDMKSSYNGKQYWNGSTHDRYDSGFLNERENYYHKPVANINWYSNFTEKMSLYSTVYYSGGKGGGTGTYGSMQWDYSTPSRRIDWDATIAKNDTSTSGSYGILRNSLNNQWTIGAISKLNYKFTDKVNSTFGVDWRTAEIEHGREVRDLLGGDYVFFDGNDFDSAEDYQKELGDKIDYHFTNTVDWLGFFGQSEYSSGPVNAYGMAGYSMIQYTYTNHFSKDATTGKEVTSETDWISGFQVKGGAGYRVTDNMDVFGNFGYVDRVPIFDDLINDRTGTKAEDPKNEKFLSIEGGVNYWGLDGKLMLKSNFYYTAWNDKSFSLGITEVGGEEGIIFIQGTDLLHMGLEFEAAYQPINMFRLDAVAAIGNWKYTDDVSGVYKDYAGGGAEDVEYTFYIKDLKSGDAPQTQLSLIGSVFPIEGATAQIVGRYYANHYANWDPFSRTDPDDTAQSWKAPNYFVMDFHGTYDLPFDVSGVKLQLFAHVFNLLDTEYIQDAVDNSAYNAWDDDHDADDAEVYFGLPRTFNIGLHIAY